MRLTKGTLFTLALFASACSKNESTPPPQTAVPAGGTPSTAAAAPGAPAAPAATAEAPKPSLLDLEKKAVATGFATFNKDMKTFLDLYTPDANLMVAGMPDSKGRDALAKDAEMMTSAFPDVQVKPTRVFYIGDVVVAEWVAAGTHKGELMGVKATNKPAGWHGAIVLWFTPEGLVKEEHRYSDVGTVMSQIGASKDPARPVAALPTAEAEVIVGDGSANAAATDTAKKLYSTFSGKDVNAFLAMVPDDSTYSDYTQPADMKGKADAKKFYEMMTKAFPDMKADLNHAWGAAEWVIAEGTFGGTQKGPLGPIKATNKSATMHGLDIWKVKDGKIAQGASYSNNMEMAQQLGLMEKPAGKDDKKAAPAAAKPAAPASAPAMKGPAAPAAAPKK